MEACPKGAAAVMARTHRSEDMQEGQDLVTNSYEGGHIEDHFKGHTLRHLRGSVS